MLKYEEFRPQFVSFGRHISARRAGQLTLQEFAEHREAFGAFLVQLEARLNWEAPLVALFSEAGETLAELPQHLTTLRQELENDGIVPGAAEDLHRSLERFRHLQAQLPVMCDVEVFNEILLLAGPVKEQAQALDREALLQRLPAALDWLNAQEASWSLFGALFEDHSSWSEKARRILNALRGGCGGLFAALESEKAVSAAEAEQACRLLVDALKALSSVASHRRLVEFDEFATNDFRLARALLAHERTGSVPAEAQAEVNAYLRDRRQTLESLKLQLSCREDHIGDAGVLHSLEHAFLRGAQDWSTNPGKNVVVELMAWEERFRTAMQGPAQIPTPEVVIDASMFEEVTQ